MTHPSPNRLRYFANVRLPSERANSIQIVNMCAAFAGCGWKVELVHPRRYNRFKTAAPSLHAHYGVADNFAVRKIFSLDCIDLGGCSPFLVRIARSSYTERCQSIPTI